MTGCFVSQSAIGASRFTPAAASVVMAVAAYFTFSAMGGAAAGGTAQGAATGTATCAEVAAATIGQAAIQAGAASLAGTAAVSAINHKGELGAVLEDLGSSETIRGIATAMVTAGALNGLGLNNLNIGGQGEGAATWTANLGRKLQAGMVRAVVGTAINGGSLEAALSTAMSTALIDTAAAQGAHWIGDATRDSTAANLIAHAIAGCAVGAARGGNGDGCGAGALGATIGEIAAGLKDKDGAVGDDTIRFATLMATVAAAVAGVDPNVAGQAASTALRNILGGTFVARTSNQSIGGSSPLAVRFCDRVLCP